MREENRKPLVVFSGGMDSTYVLWQQLLLGDVYTCYIRGAQSPLKVPREMEARRNIIAFLQKLTGNIVISDTIVKLGKNGFAVETEINTGRYYPRHENNIMPDHSWNQAHMWLFGSLYVSDGMKYHSKLMIGNVMADDINSHLDDQIAAWDHLQLFSKHHPIPLEFPLRYTSKDYILRRMPIELLELVWICELPDTPKSFTLSGDGTMGEVKQIKPCNRCHACVTMLQTVWAKEHLGHEQPSRTLEEYIEKQKKGYQREPSQMSFDFPYYIDNDADQPKDIELVEIK